MTAMRRDVAVGEALRLSVAEVAAEVTVRIRRELPVLGAARYLDPLVEGLVGQFIDPSGAAADEVVSRGRDAGAREAREGRGPEVLHAAVRLGTGIAIARLAEHARRLGLGDEIGAVGRMAQTAFAHTERLVEAVTEGHAGVGALDGRERDRRALVDLLLRPEPGAAEIRAAARAAGWPVPTGVAVVAVRPGGPAVPRGLPHDTLPALHLDEPCLVMPDPDGPGRRGGLAASLRGWAAAIGPTVAVTDAARSLRWARRALRLVGRVDAGRSPVRATDHLPRLMTSWGAELVDYAAADRLAPLAAVRAPLRADLEATLLALLECHFRANAAAERLHVHPQTVRYRLRKIEALFGDGLYDPRIQLDLHLLLHARLADRHGHHGE
ncbi:Sugar diacid utilization regulator [Actinokineospora sp. UTMC 2448]|nr:Sugar diacid utilization regulator [Actinokineospora sp. UTMC 2448]